MPEKLIREVWLARRRGDIRECYQQTLFRVKSKYPNGTPREVEIIPDDPTVHVEDGMEFIIGWVRRAEFEKTTGG